MSLTATRIRGIDTHHYLAKDLQRAIAFYRDVLGITPSATASWEHGTEFELGDGSTFGVFKMPNDTWYPCGGVVFAVEDVDAMGPLAAQLSTLQVAILKVDRTEIESPNDAFALARARGIKVYGKGIEDEAHRRRLLRHGCEIGQGYLFSRALPAAEAERYLRANLNTASALGR